MSDVPFRYDVDAHAADLQDRHEGLEPGTETGERASVAGRLMLRRVQGKLAFGTLQDMTGRIQLFAPQASTPEFEAFTELSLGDWIGVRGEVMTTRRGELSVRVDEWTLLAETTRSFPDKWHGLTDPDTRYRQRYVDLWVTPEARDSLLMRSRMISLLRRWLDERDFVEVETPVFHEVASGALARPFVTHHNALDRELYLRIALELHLKRLIVGGIERVYEVGRVFRNEGLSPRHQPEFTMLELYQAYADYGDIMELVEQLVAHLATELTGSTTVTHDGRELDLTPPWRRASMTDLVDEVLGVRIEPSLPVERARALAREHGVEPEDGWGTGKILVELYEEHVEKSVWDPVFVIDHPREVSPLARDHREIDGLTERFEAIVAGRELANAFSELGDPDEQRARFAEQAEQRAAGDDEAMELDEDFLRALEYGMPPTGGLGIGIDRLIMLLADETNIRDVVAFPTLREEQR